MGEFLLIGVATCQLILFISALRLSKAIRQSFTLQQATHKLVSATDLSIQRIEKLSRIEDQLTEKMKKLERPSVELQEFLADVAEHGCSILRFSPDSILIRGLRK